MNSENERRVLSERLEAMQQSVTEQRRNNELQSDQLVRLKSEINNLELQRHSLEAQLRLSNWPAEASTQQSSDRHSAERAELKLKVDSLQDKVLM